MKNILKLSLAAMAISALAACGGGGSSEPADKYVGNWKSACYQDTGNDGQTYYYITNWTGAKASAGEVAFTGTYLWHSDNTCANQLGKSNSTPRKMNIGAETTFLGAKSDNIVLTNMATGEAFPGYATAADGKMYFRTYTPGTTPTNWGRSSPWTKQ